jgi:hypothetical protein
LFDVWSSVNFITLIAFSGDSSKSLNSLNGSAYDISVMTTGSSMSSSSSSYSILDNDI